VNERSAAIGARLRRIRQQQRLSLADVQERSDGRWKAVVVGAYERGDRAMSIARLAELAAFYGVPLVDLLPTEPAPATGAAAPVRLDLGRLATATSVEARAVARFAAQIRRQRGDHDRRVLTLRSTDLDTLALTIGTDASTLRAALDRDGIVADAAIVGGEAVVRGTG
jgi:transcriptional regulator with XRE-family HTH domain